MGWYSIKMNKTEICMLCKCNCEHLQRKTYKRTKHNAGENLLKLSLSRIWILGLFFFFLWPCNVVSSAVFLLSFVVFYSEGKWKGRNITRESG